MSRRSASRTCNGAMPWIVMPRISAFVGVGFKSLFLNVETTLITIHWITVVARIMRYGAVFQSRHSRENNLGMAFDTKMCKGLMKPFFKPTLPRPCDAGLGPHHDGTLFMCEADGGSEEGVSLTRILRGPRPPDSRFHGNDGIWRRITC